MHFTAERQASITSSAQRQRREEGSCRLRSLGPRPSFCQPTLSQHRRAEEGTEETDNRVHPSRSRTRTSPVYSHLRSRRASASVQENDGEEKRVDRRSARTTETEEEEEFGWALSRTETRRQPERAGECGASAELRKTTRGFLCFLSEAPLTVEPHKRKNPGRLSLKDG
ncbi:hypothetical protein AOLI_G00222800 [Acnodon oligacanthus]